MTKFNIGDKVIPISKTVDWNTLNRVTDHLDKSGVWNRASGNEQTFLYVSSIDKFRNLYICSNEQDGDGDYFHESDLIPYKTKQTKKQRITALENEVAELKLIVHELRGKKSIEPSTTNTVEDIIEFEGQQYRKVDRKAREGDVVMQDVEHSAWMEKGHFYRVLSEGKVFLGKGVETILYTGWNGRTVDTVNVYELIESKPLTPNQQRAAIIEKAKQFVEENKVIRNHGDIEMKVYINKKTLNWVDAEFIVNEKKRTVDCLLRWTKDKSLDGRGIAKCNPNDVFNEHIGKAIALGRALGLDVSEFEQAVQPTVAIGQLLARKNNKYNHTRWKVDDLNDTGKNLTIIDNEFESLNGETADGGYLPEETWYKIINDTNAIYEVES